MAPDGSFLVFQSTRPIAAPTPDKPTKPVSNLWRVNRTGNGWTEPERLPDAVNITHSVWKPSVAADSTIYFTVVSAQGKRLYSSQFHAGSYETAQPLSFSDGTTGDVDPEIAPDGSFLIFCSSGRLKGDDKDHLYLTRRQGTGWDPVVSMRYSGDDAPYGFSTDDEPHLGPDPSAAGRRSVYFSSDRSAAVHFPRSRAQAEKDLERMNAWDNGNSNVWVLPLAAWIP